MRTFKQDVTGNPRAMMKLMNSADVAKHTLSTLGSSNCFVDSLYDGMDFECNVSRCVAHGRCQERIGGQSQLLCHQLHVLPLCGSLQGQVRAPVCLSF